MSSQPVHRRDLAAAADSGARMDDDDDAPPPLLFPPSWYGREEAHDGPHRPTSWIRHRSSNAFILATVCLALFADAFQYGVVVPITPSVLRDRLHVSEDDEQLYASLMLAVFGAALLVASPVVGIYADKTASRRGPMLFGFAVLGASVALFGLASNILLLLLARALQGFSTAITWTLSLALIVDSVPKERVGVCMGTALSSNSFAMVISPLIGGVVYNGAGMLGLLATMFALVAVALAFVGLMIEKGDAVKASRPDERQRIRHDSGIGYGTLDSFPDLPEDVRKSDGHRSLRGRRSIVSLPPLINISPIPLADATLPPMLYLLQSPRVLTGLYGVFMQFGILASFDATLPLFVQRTFHWSSLGAGLIFLTVALPALLGPLVGKVSDAVGPRKTALAGSVLMAPPLLLLRLVEHDTRGQVLLLCGLLAAAGLSNALIISPLAADLSFAVDEMEARRPGIFGSGGGGAYGQAYALFNCAMAAATFCGPLLTGGVESKYGWRGVSLCLGVWCASAVPLVLLFIGDGIVVIEGEGVVDEG